MRLTKKPSCAALPRTAICSSRCCSARWPSAKSASGTFHGSADCDDWIGGVGKNLACHASNPIITANPITTARLWWHEEELSQHLIQFFLVSFPVALRSHCAFNWRWGYDFKEIISSPHLNAHGGIKKYRVFSIARDASLHHAKWSHDVAPLGVVQRCISHATPRRMNFISKTFQQLCPCWQGKKGPFWTHQHGQTCPSSPSSIVWVSLLPTHPCTSICISCLWSTSKTFGHFTNKWFTCWCVRNTRLTIWVHSWKVVLGLPSESLFFCSAYHLKFYLDCKMQVVSHKCQRSPAITGSWISIMSCQAPLHPPLLRKLPGEWLTEDHQRTSSFDNLTSSGDLASVFCFCETPAALMSLQRLFCETPAAIASCPSPVVTCNGCFPAIPAQKWRWCNLHPQIASPHFCANYQVSGFTWHWPSLIWPVPGRPPAGIGYLQLLRKIFTNVAVV